ERAGDGADHARVPAVPAALRRGCADRRVEGLAMSRVRFQDVSHTYAGATEAAVDRVTLDIADGELFVLLGPSGCGKSSLLKLIAGLEEPGEGAIRLDDDLVNHTSPGSRNVAMVFQNYALYPHMTVR